jgi:hypothetical protein
MKKRKTFAAQDLSCWLLAAVLPQVLSPPLSALPQDETPDSGQ